MTVAAPAAASRTAYLVFAVSAAVYAYGFFHRVAPSVMVDGLMADLAIGGAVVGTLSSLYFYAYAGVQLPAGALVDRHGPRATLLAALFMIAVGSALFALARSTGFAYAGRFLAGLGASFTYVACLKVATDWFSWNRFSFLSGLTLTAGMLGAIGGQLPLAWAVEALGWRGSMWLSVALAVMLVLLVWGMVRDGPYSAARSSHEGWRAPLGRVARRRQNWMISVVAAAIIAPVLSFSGFWSVGWLMQAQGLERSAAAATSSLMMIGWGVGAPALGWLADKSGRRRSVLAGGLAFSCLGFMVLLFVPIPLTGLGLLYFVIGLSLGTAAIPYALARRCNDPGSAATAYAFVTMAMTGTGAVLQPTVGFLLDLQWEGAMTNGARFYSSEAYQTALLTFPAVLLLGFLLSLAIRDAPEN